MPQTGPGRFARLRPLLFLPPVAAAAGVLALAVAGREPPAKAQPVEAARAVRVLTLAETDFVPRVSGFGVVEPARSWTAAAQVAGRVGALSPEFQRGGFVEAGAEIARIADDDYRIALARAEAEAAALDARLAELDLLRENAEASLEIEREALALSERERARQRDLVERGTASAATLEAQERQTLTQRARVQELENQIALHPTQRRALAKEREAAETALRRAELDLARTVIRAPFAARVESVAMERDQFVGVGASLGRLYGVAAAEIDVQLPQSRMRDFVRAVYGDRAAYDPSALTGDALSRRLSAEIRLSFEDETVAWPATVSRPSATLDPQARSFGVIVRVDAPFEGDPATGRPPLFRGLFVEAEIAGPPITGALVAPRAALHRGVAHVADAEDRLRLRPVTVAMTVDGAALIADGLAPGDRLVLTDLPAAVEGMALIPVEDAEAAARLAAAAAGAPAAIR